ncbi:MAG: DUF885 family protein [Phycisphaerales bacterium]
MRTPVRSLAFTLSLLVAAPLAAAAPDPRPNLAADIERLGADLDEHARFYPIIWSEDLLEQRHTFLRARLAALEAFDFAALSQSARVDYLLLRNSIRALISDNRLAARRLAEMDPVLTVRGPILALETARWRMEPLDPRVAAERLASIPALAKSARARLDAGRRPADAAPPPPDQPQPVTLSPSAALRASRALDQFVSTLDRYFEHYDGFEPSFAWWCRQPFGEARAAVDDLARFLREEIAGVRNKPEDPLIGDPIGRDALLESLRDEFVGLSPEELIELGDREMAWCLQEMKRAAQDMGLGDDWRSALAKVKLAAEPPGGQTAYVTDVAREATRFVVDRDLVTVPPLCEETWRIRMIQPREQRVLPFAVYYGQAIGVAYANQSMTHDDKLMSMRGNNRHFTRIVVPHELIPGHHLQGFTAQRERPERRRFSTPFYVEGWALYWEMKLWDLDWARSPEDRVGMLFWRMHRCARITVSLRFHLGLMSPAEMIDFLVDNVGHERFTATSEVRRFIGGDYSPLYQCGYMIGGLQLRALWREAVGPSTAPAMTEKQFNDAVLNAGTIPIELLRAELLGPARVPLTRDAEASWRFDRAP